MRRVAGQYTVDIYVDGSFKEGSADNVNQYDHVYFDESEYVFPTLIGIKVFKGDEQLASAVIGSEGGATSVHDTAVVYEDARIIICCSDSIFCLSVPDLALLWKTQADPITCFEVFEYRESYIVHGELEISRLDKDGQILWQRSGADIFVTLDGEVGFTLTEDHIIVKDFENRVYKFDYDGNEFTDMAQFT